MKMVIKASQTQIVEGEKEEPFQQVETKRAIALPDRSDLHQYGSPVMERGGKQETLVEMFKRGFYTRAVVVKKNPYPKDTGAWQAERHVQKDPHNWGIITDINAHGGLKRLMVAWVDGKQRWCSEDELEIIYSGCASGTIDHILNGETRH